MDVNAVERFRDTRERIYNFADEVLVRCPSCDGCAVVIRRGHEESDGRCMCRYRRLRCRTCAFARDQAFGVRVFGAPVDPYYQRPLWLQANCRGHVLWAYNERHLDLLEGHVAARLRERGTVGPFGHTSLLERLPAWVTSAKNRSEVLKAIKRMRATLPPGDASPVRGARMPAQSTTPPAQ